MAYQFPITVAVDDEAAAQALRLKVEKILAALPVEVGDIAAPFQPLSAASPGQIMVWTDGGCDMKKNGVGAWAYVIKLPDGSAHEHASGEFDTTNNRMELIAVIRALEALEIGPEIVIHADSEYVIKGCTQWARNWVKNGWKTYQGNAVINRDLWEILLALYQLHNVRFVHVKGHSGIVENERCDELCTAKMQELHKDALAAGPAMQ
ncbi:MAG: ribonuclease HI [Aquamicrobium sp.]|uniref:ribonuclease H family protein n=1 Tax=Aquamicrobium sp. TaxID=1872579 RepID=UPI00349EC0DE|nr:ribonuclease HI [Aquamicrobium sp.]